MGFPIENVYDMFFSWLALLSSLRFHKLPPPNQAGQLMHRFSVNFLRFAGFPEKA
jgi:hypothetical protein